MEAVKLKLLAPACCPNCGYDMRPDNNTILPVKLMNDQGSSDAAATIDGLFNYVVKPVEPPRKPMRPRSRTPPRDGRPPYRSRSPVKQAVGRRSRRASRIRSRNRKLKEEPKAVPPINPVQKRLLKIASEDVKDVKIEPPVPVPTTRFAADDHQTSVKGASEPPLPDVDKFLTTFFDDNDGRKAASPKKPTPQIRVLQPENFVLRSSDPPEFGDAGSAVSVPTESGRVVAIHNHFYSETVVIPDSP